MPAALPVRSDFDSQTLRGLARRSEDSNQSRRLLSLAAVYDGMSRTQAARIGGMDRQTLRRWVLRFNGDGPAGLLDRWSRGPARRLSDDQRGELAAIVESGPEVQTHGVVRWRRVDLRAVIKERFGVDYGERWVSQILHDLGFSHISARPRHPRQDAKTIEAFKKTSPAHCRPTKPSWSPLNRLKSGSRMKRASARRTALSASGPAQARDRASPPISAIRMPICSAPSARRAASGRPS